MPCSAVASVTVTLALPKYSSSTRGFFGSMYLSFHVSSLPVCTMRALSPFQSFLGSLSRLVFHVTPVSSQPPRRGSQPGITGRGLHGSVGRGVPSGYRNTPPVFLGTQTAVLRTLVCATIFSSLEMRPSGHDNFPGRDLRRGLPWDCWLFGHDGLHRPAHVDLVPRICRQVRVIGRIGAVQLARLGDRIIGADLDVRRGAQYRPEL
ncbi:Uncharacterised protein [Mycobacteroides abscessus subsp. bolletii]|nr:Uncharacterised protein [Mycobacteroides abscessus subsp. bolletii]